MADTLDTLLLDGLAGFAGALSDPLLAIAVLLAAALAPGPSAARFAAVLLGLGHGGLGLALATAPTAPLPTLVGAIAAGGLLGELALQLVLPAVRVVGRALRRVRGLLSRLR